MDQSGMNQRTIFLQHAAEVAQTGRNVVAIFVVEQIVDAGQSYFHFDDALVQIVDEFAGGGRQFVNLVGDVRETGGFFGAKSGIAGRAGGLRSTGQNFEKIFAQGAGAGNGHDAVGFYGDVRLRAEINFHASRILGIETDFADPSDRRTIQIANFGAGFQTAGILKIGMVGGVFLVERPGFDKDGDNQQGCDDQNKNTDQ